MTFVVRKRIELAHLGEGWEQAYITLTPFTFNDNATLLKFRALAQTAAANPDAANEATNEVMSMVKNKFLEGMGFDGKKLVPITKDNLADLPIEVITYILAFLQGQTVIPPKE